MAPSSTVSTVELCIATTQDGNIHLLLIAFPIVEEKTQSATTTAPPSPRSFRRRSLNRRQPSAQSTFHWPPLEPFSTTLVLQSLSISLIRRIEASLSLARTNFINKLFLFYFINIHFFVTNGRRKKTSKRTK